MWASWMVFIILLMPIKISKCCVTRINYPIEELMVINEKSPWLMLVVDSKHKSDHIIKGLCYGSLIHPYLVITSAAGVAEFNAEDLKIIPSSIDLVNYEFVLVQDSFFRPGFDEDNIKDIDWVILALESSFELNKQINPISVANSEFDPKECFTYNWRIVESYSRPDSQTIRKIGEIHTAYPVSLAPENFGIQWDHEIGLEDGNCVIEDCGATLTIFQLSFLGSPVVCRAIDSDQLVQVGFSTLIYGLTEKGNLEAAVNSTGTFVQFGQDFHYIKDLISESSH